MNFLIIFLDTVQNLPRRHLEKIQFTAAALKYFYLAGITKTGEQLCKSPAIRHIAFSTRNQIC
jgi:hypothetical protein